MWSETSSTGSIWSAIAIIVIIWAIFGGGFGARTAYGAEVAGCDRVSNCQVEKTDIINTATTQNLINQQAEATRAQATSLYIQDQATQLFDCKMKGMEERILTGQTLIAKDNEIAILKQQIYNDARFNTLERGQERIACDMLKEPKLYGQAFVTTGQPIPCGTSGFGL